ncbi:MAG: mechanosensitive ion channel [Deltaproteobacteria bacterium]|jgi:small conductance mechanosensitive channel|nr:mechanosensitive ion channel [Deltaproteobacteria bacterium]
MFEHILARSQELIALYGLNAVAAVLILLIGRWIAHFVRKLIHNVMHRTKVDPTLISFVASLSYVAMIAFVILAALGKLGIQTTSFIAVLGAAGLAVGLALQGSLSNFAAGVLMIVFKPFKVGDFIEAGGTSGTVEKIEIFTTILKSPDNKTIIVPNSKVGGGNIINYSAEPTRLVDIQVAFNYKDDIEKIETLLRQILDGDERILKTPAPAIGIAQFTETSVKIALRPWVKTEDYAAVTGYILRKVKELFDSKELLFPLEDQPVFLARQGL